MIREMCGSTLKEKRKTQSCENYQNCNKLAWWTTQATKIIAWTW